MANLLGEDIRKIHPRLRMIANCSTEVNAFRAEQSGIVTVATAAAAALPMLRGSEPLALSLSELSTPPALPKLEHLAEDVFVNVFVETQDAREEMPKVLQGQSHSRRCIEGAAPRLGA